MYVFASVLLNELNRINPYIWEIPIYGHKTYFPTFMKICMYGLHSVMCYKVMDILLKIKE